MMKERPFNELVDRLKIYLARYPGESDRVRSLFRDAGFSLPFGRLRAVSNYAPFRRFIAAVWRRATLSAKITVLFDSPEQLLKLAEQVRDEFWRKASILRDRQPLPEGMARRWYVQQVRFVFNRLMFLATHGD